MRGATVGRDVRRSSAGHPGRAARLILAVLGLLGAVFSPGLGAQANASAPSVRPGGAQLSSVRVAQASQRGSGAQETKRRASTGSKTWVVTTALASDGTAKAHAVADAADHKVVSQPVLVPADAVIPAASPVSQRDDDPAKGRAPPLFTGI